ncbi:MAG: UPF0182 family protein, partial [Elusimicrobia bacterium]|nr:UPF0182 family protein [Elusimicrobiota bacterium]
MGTLAVLGLAVLCAAALSLGRLLELYVDWLWFAELGCRRVFLTTLAWESAAGTCGGLAVFALLYGNWRLARPGEAGAPPTGDLPDKIRKFMPWTCLAVAALAGLSFGREWRVWLPWLRAVPFGKSDPLFGLDLGFYLFSLPAWRVLQGALSLFSTLAAVLAAGAYVLNGDIAWEGGRPRLGGRAARHLLAAAALVLFAWAWGDWLDRYGLLTRPGHAFFGAAYADVHARLPGLAVSALASLAAALGLLVLSARRAPPGMKLALGLFLGAFAVRAAAVRLVPELLQRFVVLPNEIALEEPFIARNIAMTRAAYGLEAVRERDFPAEPSVTPAELADHRGTLENVPIWDERPLLASLAQLQEIRPYYRFAAVYNDRYRIGGRYRQVLLSARELDAAKLPSRTWINEKLAYTHGYGLVMGLVNESGPEGQPVLLVKDIPPSGPPGLEVARPEIYFGNLARGWVAVGSRAREFDFPRSDDNVYSSYGGSGGIVVGGPLRRLALALRLSSLKLLLSRDITAQSRVLLRRDILERALAITPFLDYDRSPYLALAEGRLVWILDAYTRGRTYPYATPFGGVNYIRNSVKVTVDAYTGETRFYAAQPQEPVLRAWDAVFPGLFRPLAEMPPALREHLRHPR